MLMQLASVFGISQLIDVPNLPGPVTMQYIWVNGVDQGKNVGIRVPPNNNPVEDVSSPNIACNVNGATGVAQTISVPSGAEVSGKL